MQLLQTGYFLDWLVHIKEGKKRNMQGARRIVLYGRLTPVAFPLDLGALRKSQRNSACCAEKPEGCTCLAAKPTFCIIAGSERNKKKTKGSILGKEFSVENEGYMGHVGSAAPMKGIVNLCLKNDGGSATCMGVTRK